MLNLEEITNKVKEIAVETGLFLQEERKNFNRDSVKEKDPHNYVTYVDKEAERRIVEQLSALLPQAGFIAEEGTGNLTKETYCWVVDPLDGTTNFIHDNAPYCVSIALRNQEELLVGVVYEVCRKECFWAWKGSAAYMNGKEIHVSEVADLNEAFLALGLPYAVDQYKPTALRLIDKLYGNVSSLRLQGASAAEICYVAAGRFEGRVEAFLGPWDVAAGGLILQQAGGKITDFEGKDTWMSGRQVVATNGKVHEALLKIVTP